MNDRRITHSESCWHWGSAHYECALNKIAEQRMEIEKLHTELNRVMQAAANGGYCRREHKENRHG